MKLTKLEVRCKGIFFFHVVSPAVSLMESLVFPQLIFSALFILFFKTFHHYI